MLGPKLVGEGGRTGPDPEPLRLKMTRTRQLSRRTLWRMAMRFWKTTSSARTARRPERATISRWDCSRWVSRAMTVDCQIWSYWVRTVRSSARTVLLRLSRKTSTRPACFFSILRRVSWRKRDCSSMYWSEREVLDSRSCRRLVTVLKNDSWTVGEAEEALEEAVLLREAAEEE